MTDAVSAWGELTDARTLTIQRVLPGPIERVWRYLTDSDLRRKWLAAGDMPAQAGASFKLTWRNNELSNPPGKQPEGWPEEQSMESRIVMIDEPRRLVITWGDEGEVSFELAARGDGKVLLTLVHRGLPGHPVLLDIAGGWHSHLDILLARLSGSEPEPFWDYWARIRNEYDQRLPA